ncbi:MAG TPA: hypothetical protein VMZ28_16155, partial [Kofleriaceae bacterium]|nr:hypothetical protein [Kofleriaceae bacterium]
ADRLRVIRGETDAAVRVHRAIGAATFEQRMYLHVAMKVAGVFPLPPPAVHQSFEVMAEIDRLALAVQDWHLIEPGS